MDPPAPAPAPLSLPIGTFNVNFNARLAEQGRDIRGLFAAPVDVFGLQECNEVDLAAVAPPGWRAYQDRRTRGRANTAILYRDTLRVVDAGSDPYIDRPDDDLGARFIAWVRLDSGLVIASAHREPWRDRRFWPQSDARLREWAAPFERVIICIDSNVHRHADLEAATGLSWRGSDVDGFLYRGLTLSKPTALDEPVSDHPCVVTTATIKE